MAADRRPLLPRGVALEGMTVGYNTLEGIVAIAARLAAGSIALTGFGIDSVIEVTSGALLWWRLRAELSPASAARMCAPMIFLVPASATSLMNPRVSCAPERPRYLLERQQMIVWGARHYDTAAPPPTIREMTERREGFVADLRSRAGAV